MDRPALQICLPGADPGRVQRPFLTVVLTVLCAALLAPGALPASRPGQAALSTLESGVLVQLNHIRAKHGLQPLALSSSLSGAAEQHSQEMGVDGYFEHESADGTAFWKRIDRWYGSNGFSYWSVGENLLWSSPAVSPAGALKLWMSSPEHRANILTARWREVGVSAVHEPSAPGVYHGREVTIITTDFGVRR
jgi:uncharacterized protein YkwD